MWTRYLLVSLAVMCIANTISHERLFKPLRDRLGGKETWRGYLFTCPYCLSHWLAFALVPLFKLELLTVPYDWGLATWLLEWFFNSILVVILAAFIRMLFFSIDDLVGVFRRYEKLEEQEIERRSRSGYAKGVTDNEFSGSWRPPGDTSQTNSPASENPGSLP